MDACLRQGLLPVMMEHLPASADTAVSASLQMVDEADVYLAIIGFRYGHMPPGSPKSITHMEYDRAVERKIPRLMFVMHDDHPVRAAEVDKGLAATKLDEFKAVLRAENVILFFRSPEELRGGMIDSLSKLRADSGLPARVKHCETPGIRIY